MNNYMNLSIFQNMTSKLPQPGSLEEVANLIRSDEKILPRIPRIFFRLDSV